MGGLVVGWLGGGCGVGLGNAELNCLVCCGLSCCIVDMGGLVGGGVTPALLYQKWKLVCHSY